MKVYKRIVRDKIPDIMLKDNTLPVTRILDDKEYIEELNKKLKTEVDKYLDTNNIEEMIDILEVIRAIIDYKGSSYTEIENKRKKKAKVKGTFKDRVYLEKVMVDGD